MNKPIIGVIPTIVTSDDDLYECNEHIVNMYLNMVLSSGAIPFMLPVKDNKIDEAILDLCDGFLIPGSVVIKNYYYDVIDYALKNKKALLGICAGMQAIGIYSQIIAKIGEYNLDKFWQEYKQIKLNNDGNILPKLTGSLLNNHFHRLKTKDLIEKARHNINIKDDSHLYDAYGKNKNIVSAHLFHLINCGNMFKVTAYSDDNVIEAIEYKNDNFIVGIQGHIEIEQPVDKLFENFIKYIKNNQEK